MEPISIDEALAVTAGELVAGDGRAGICSITTDTRGLSRGDFFIPLKGKRFDGHDYLDVALDGGCSGAVCSRLLTDADIRKWSSSGAVLIRVDDTLRALQQIAKRYRERFQIPLVAITGSNGKTTTKDMVAAIAAGSFSVLGSEGTFNNDVGVPLTLLRLERHHSLAVLELGMNSRGEIARLAGIAAPTIGVITNVGPAHLEFLGTVEEVATSKAELLEAMVMHNGGVAVLNCDDPYVSHMGKRLNLKVKTFGMGPGADVRAESVHAAWGEVKFLLSFKGNSRPLAVAVPVVGVHNVYNALAAAAVCEELGMEPGEIAERLRDVRLPPMRMETSVIRGITVINDAYNANPASTRAALEAFKGVAAGGKKILVMGDMLELGASAERAHREIGHSVVECGLDLLIAVGELGAFAAEGAKQAGMSDAGVVTCADAREAASVLQERASEGDCVLLKASRRVGLERVL
ncbi:MAG: UDP-N-acetylmuramoyl-tripeptide--D-alanyl-D-alanine ligase, partial [bacterium]